MRHACPLALLVFAGAALARPPVFIGASARGAVPPDVEAAVTVALAKAASAQSVEDLSGAVDEDTAALHRELDDALQKFSDVDFEGALVSLDKALGVFEQGLCFSESKDAWVVYRDMMTLRVLVLSRLERDRAADKALAQLLAIDPAYAPDPSRAPPELVERHHKLAGPTAKWANVTLDVRSKATGSRVVLDGRPAGTAPLVVADLRPGVHYVTVLGDGGRHTERLVAERATLRIEAPLDDPRRVAARAAVRALAGGSIAKGELVDLCARVSDDAIVALIVPVEHPAADGAAARFEILAAHVSGGDVVGVVGVAIDAGAKRDVATDDDRTRTMGTLLAGALAARSDAWLDDRDGRDAASPRQTLLRDGGGGDDETAISPVILWTGIGVIAATLVGAAGVGVLIYSESRKDAGFTFRLDTAGVR